MNRAHADDLTRRDRALWDYTAPCKLPRSLARAKELSCQVHIPQRPQTRSYDTNHDTKSAETESVMPQVVEGMVGTRRLELLTSTVSR